MTSCVSAPVYRDVRFQPPPLRGAAGLRGGGTLWAPGGRLSTPWRKDSDRDWARCRGGRQGQLARPCPRHRTAPTAGWGHLGSCRCPFPVEGRRARVARGGKARRPFRRVTAAESRRLSHPRRPSLPGPEWPGPGQTPELGTPPAVPRARNWGRWAAGLALRGLAWACGALPGRPGAHTQGPSGGLEPSFSRTRRPHPSPVLRFLVEREGSQLALEALTVMPALCWALGIGHLRYRISWNLRPRGVKDPQLFGVTKLFKSVCLISELIRWYFLFFFF